MFLLFIVYHILNAGWHKNLLHGKYSPIRIFQLVIDLLVFLSMIGLMISGIMLSNHVFDFLDIHGGTSFAQLLHMASSYWGFVLMALHLGLHWRMIAGMVRKALKRKQPSRVSRILIPVLGAGIAVYGLIAFIRRDLLTYMLVRTHFVFLDFGESIPLFYLDYLAIMGTFIFAAPLPFRAAAETVRQTEEDTEMKKILVLFLSMTMVLALAACGTVDTDERQNSSAGSPEGCGLRWKEKRRAADLRNRICFPSV